jgi:hypothetical protein
MFNKLVTSFLLVTLVGQLAIAQEAKYLFTTISAGDEAPYNGYLLKPETLVKIYTDSEEKEKRQKLECNAKLANINLDLSKLTESKDIERDVIVKSYEELLTNRRKQLLAQQNTINELNSTIVADRIFIVGSFGAGIILAITITYFVAGMK